MKNLWISVIPALQLLQLPLSVECMHVQEIQNIQTKNYFYECTLMTLESTQTTWRLESAQHVKC